MQDARDTTALSSESAAVLFEAAAHCARCHLQPPAHLGRAGNEAGKGMTPLSPILQQLPKLVHRACQLLKNSCKAQADSTALQPGIAIAGRTAWSRKNAARLAGFLEAAALLLPMQQLHQPHVDDSNDLGRAHQAQEGNSSSSCLSSHRIQPDKLLEIQLSLLCTPVPLPQVSHPSGRVCRNMQTVSLFPYNSPQAVSGRWA